MMPGSWHHSDVGLAACNKTVDRVHKVLVTLGLLFFIGVIFWRKKDGCNGKPGEVMLEIQLNLEISK